MLPHRHLTASVGLLLATMLVSACEEPPEPPVAPEDLLRLQAEGIVYGMRSFLLTEGVRSGEVAADSAYTFPDSSRTYLFAMSMTLYYEDGTDRARINADSAQLNTRTEELIAWGNVVARVLDQGVTIETAELNYDPTGSRIWSDSSTVIRRDDGSVTRGTAFESDLQLLNWVLENPVGDIPAERRGGN